MNTEKTTQQGTDEKRSKFGDRKEDSRDDKSKPIDKDAVKPKYYETEKKKLDDSSNSARP